MMITAMKKRLFICFLLLSLGMLSALAQTPTTQGKEFWASFMRNGYNSNSSSYNHFTLIASAKRACTVTVENPSTGWTTQFAVPQNGVNTYYVDPTQGYNSQMGGIDNKGLYITSTDTISLYIANEAENSYDAANVLPAGALGSQYMVQSYKTLNEQSSHVGDNRASFLVLATEDNTEVQIVPSCETYDNHVAGRPYTISLNRGQCYHVLNKNAGSELTADGDFSGTTVVSADDKPIAVFNGNSITSVPGGLSTGYDHIFEQAMPTDYWGKEFVVTSTKCPNYMNLYPDQIKVIALFNNTTVTRDGNALFTLDAGETGTFEMNLVNDPCTHLVADNPIAVFLYQHSHGSGSPNYGDPSMVWISPVEQTVFEVTFSTFSVQQVEVHYVNIVCHTENVSEMTFDGQNIAGEFSVVPGSPEFSYTRLQVQHAAHTLRCPGGFVAHVYGIGQAEGYAYSVGSSAKTLTNQLFVNDELVTEYSICQTETVDFRLETNYEPDQVKWNFGDGSPAAFGPQVSHTYDLDGNFGVEVVVDHLVNGTPQSDTLGVTIHVNPQIELTCVDSTCNPVYYFQGIAFPVPFFGDSIISNVGGCETIYHMNITEGSSQSFVTYDTACMEYEWFDTIRYESGTYIVILNQPGGCDSLFILNLTIGKPPENPVRYKTSCMPYNWDNRVICDTTGTYRLPFTTDDYCEYDSVLYFTRHYEPPFEQIVGLTQVAVATNYWPGEYIYYLDDSTSINTSRIRWELSDNPSGAGQWDFRPHGASCTIVAYSRGSKTLRVFSGEGYCDKSRELQINCTGYAVDEQETQPLEVYPNPTKDELIVKGCEMEEVVLYDLLGQQLRVVAARGEAEARMHVGDLPQALYLLEVRTKFGNNTRLVSVIK